MVINNFSIRKNVYKIWNIDNSFNMGSKCYSSRSKSMLAPSEYNETNGFYNFYVTFNQTVFVFFGFPAVCDNLSISFIMIKVI